MRERAKRLNDINLILESSHLSYRHVSRYDRYTNFFTALLGGWLGKWATFVRYPTTVLYTMANSIPILLDQDHYSIQGVAYGSAESQLIFTHARLDGHKREMGMGREEGTGLLESGSSHLR